MDQQSFNNIKRSGSAEHAVQAAKDMETAFGQYLRRSADVFDLSKNYEVGGISQGFFLHFRKNSRRKKPKFFGLRPKTQG